MANSKGTGTNFKTYIKQLIKNNNAEVSINGRGAAEVNNLANSLGSRISRAVHALLANTGRMTVKHDTLVRATKIVLPHQLVAAVVGFADAAVARFDNSKSAGSERKKSADRAGLSIPPSRAARILEWKVHGYRVSPQAKVFLAAVLEYLLSAVLTASTQFAIDAGKARITPRHVLFAIRTNPVHNRLFKNTLLSDGVVPKATSGSAEGAEGAAKPKKAAAKPKKAAGAAKPKKAKATKKAAGAAKPKKAAGAAKPKKAAGAAKPKAATKPRARSGSKSSSSRKSSSE